MIINHMSHATFMLMCKCTYIACRAQALSGLAQGRGVVDGGVEINCLADDRRAFSLSVSSTNSVSCK